MPQIHEFLKDIDRHWKPSAPSRAITLKVLGSTALFLQTDYVRGTKDGDVIETKELKGEIQTKLKSLAGMDSALHRKHHIYLDLVSPNVPMLPVDPCWHPWALQLQHFQVHVLDVADVVVSKLKRWSITDRSDARAMVEGDYLDHSHLLERFREVVARYKFDARADLLPKMVTLGRMRLAAEAAGLSMSAWLAQLVRERTRTVWPKEVVELAGAWRDLPSAEEIRASVASDVDRETL